MPPVTFPSFAAIKPILPKAVVMIMYNSVVINDGSNILIPVIIKRITPDKVVFQFAVNDFMLIDFIID